MSRKSNRLKRRLQMERDRRHGVWRAAKEQIHKLQERLSALLDENLSLKRQLERKTAILDMVREQGGWR